jgi:two-component system sensor histidine kinase CreC
MIVNPALASIRAEPALLALALGNLLENARSFAPPGTSIVIEATGSAVSIRDFGPGVADYALPRLGERFFSTARPEYPGIPTTKGSGLGLAIVRQIMFLHGGSMEVVNAGPGLQVTLRF